MFVIFTFFKSFFFRTSQARVISHITSLNRMLENFIMLGLLRRLEIGKTFIENKLIEGIY